MAQVYSHAPVLLEEVTELLAHVPTGVVIDGTLGGPTNIGPKELDGVEAAKAKVVANASAQTANRPSCLRKFFIVLLV